MLSLDDQRWNQLVGGYRVPYDPRSALAKLESGSAEAWTELWDELHHQGDVDTASYAAVPHLVRIYESNADSDWNTFALVGVIELARDRNPPLPPWLEPGYFAALDALASVASKQAIRTNDHETLQCALGFIALARGHRVAARVLLNHDEKELADLVAE